MSTLKIQTESLPTRCEICHKADYFTPETNYCLRCAGIIGIILIDQSKIKTFRKRSIKFEPVIQEYHYQNRTIFSHWLIKSLVIGIFSLIVIAIAVPNLLPTRCGSRGASGKE